MACTIFYDSYCPLCMWEMRKLKAEDSHQKIRFVDINAAQFSQEFPDLCWAQLNARIHAKLADGRIVSGLDATYYAWKEVGKGWIYAPLRWPVIRIFANGAYTLFAKHRYRISYWLTGKKRGPACQPIEPSAAHHSNSNKD